MLYRHFAPSNTSLSDDYDDDDAAQSNFFNTDQPLFVQTSIQPHWSSKRRAQTSTAKKTAMKSPMSNIPPEILIYILKHLHSSRDLLSSLRVSRTWCECAIELLWHKPAFPKYSTLDKMARLLTRPNQTFTYAQFIRRLNFLSLGSELRDDTFSVFARCNRLERLTLVGCKHLSEDTLLRSLPRFTNVVAIDLTGVTAITSEAIVAFASAAKRLQGINLANCKNITDSALLALAANCPLLRRVKLSGLESLTDIGVAAIAQNCSLLLEIDLHLCELVSDNAVREIWMHSTHMREMRLSNCPLLTDAAFPAPIKADTQLDCPNPFPSFHIKDSTELAPLTISRPFEHLRLLDLTACAKLTDDAIEGIISHAPKIRNLVLSKCSLITDKSVEIICKLGRHLHYLHLGHANKITDRSVRMLARSCTRIRYVDFANCGVLTDMSVFELSALPKLRRIGLVRVSNLTDEAIYALAERHATLERIHLSYCDQVSVMAIHFLLLKLHKLTHLSLTGIPAFRQPEFQRFCRDAPKDFNSAQRAAFCVFSGKGVSQLRAYLTELFDHITEMNGTDDTEYEEDDDADGYHKDDTPEPETGGEEEDLPRQMFSHPNITLARSPRTGSSRREAHQRLPPHEFAIQQDRALRTFTIPAFGHHFRPRTDNSATRNVQGATSLLNAQIHGAMPPIVPAPSRRVRGFTHGNRSLVDMLPIIESSQSPPPSEAASEHSVGTNSNGAGFFRGHQHVGPVVVSSRVNGALTPDLNFAEIGHGRGAQGGLNATFQHRSVAQDRTPRQPYFEVNANYPFVSTTRSGNPRAMSDPGLPNPAEVSLPYHERILVGSSSQELQDSAHLALGIDPRGRHDHREMDSGGRGRSVKRTFRNGFNVAENYAASFLFGRASPDAQDDERS